MVHHLSDACSGHYWPLAENIKYETCYPFTVSESLEDHRRLLTDTRLMYGCVLTVTTPPRYVGGDTSFIKLTWTLPSWDLPTDVDMEDAWYDLSPNAVHGDSKKVHLDICIIKLNVDH